MKTAQMSEAIPVLQQLEADFGKLTVSSERAEFLLKSIAELIHRSSCLEKHVRTLERAIQESELFFSLPEVNLMTRQKLPHVVIRAGDVVAPGENFYEAEPYGDNDHVRWTGPDRVNNFMVPIDRSEPRTLRMSLAVGVRPDSLASIKLYVDGTLVAYESEQRGRGLELIAELPASDRTQDTLVSLFVPRLFAPNELDGSSTDTRRLGVAFHRLEVL